MSYVELKMAIGVRLVILSGGSGTRLWPFSREAFPKQFLPIVGDRSLFQDTIIRCSRLGGGAEQFELLPPIVVSNELHRFLVAEQLAELGTKPDAIVLEPISRNTAPALTLAALCADDARSNSVLVVLPSDHHVANVPAFAAGLASACKLAAEGYLVTFGIKPTHPETGFGYIRFGKGIHDAAHELDGFEEKPSREIAEEYLKSGKYLWNSGIFVLSAATWLREIGLHSPEILNACKKSLACGKRDGEFLRIDKAAFEECPSDSIDYAVMEKLALDASGSSHAAVISLDAGWSDLGSWPAFSAVREVDDAGNVTVGDVFVKDSSNSLLYSQNRFLAVVGLTDVVVVETTDAVLVAHKDSAQDVKAVTEYLKGEKRNEHLFHTKVHRPWGSYESIDNGNRYQVKRLSIKPGASLSLQLHHHRAEHWIVVKGTARVTRGDEVFLLSENESTYIPLGTKHRLENPGAIPLELIEVQSGSYLGEDDIVRFEDRYNRVDSK